jgi:hypothetical protein
MAFNRGVPLDAQDESEISQAAEKFQRQAHAAKINMQIKNAKIITALSCCFFAPCTIPYICYKEHELHQGPKQQSMG